MAEEGKKISFGFSKSIKKTVLKNVPPPEKEKVDYIECVEGKTIKIIGGKEEKDEPLVIPMLGSKTWHDRIVNKVNADIFEPKTEEGLIKSKLIDEIKIKEEKVDDVPNGDVPNENAGQPMEVVHIKQEPGAELKPELTLEVSEIKKESGAEPEQQLTLEEQAAREILADLKSGEGNEKDQKLFTVPVAGNETLEGKEESTLDDYENVPIDAFGMAMLRGMGWEPGKGIGRNEKVVPPVMPELRPKGMGLGADKLAVQKSKGKPTKEEQQLKLVKGAHVKIVAGKQSGNYGKVEGFDEEAARIIIKLALGGESITMNEYWVLPVTSAEYNQNSKVLNVKKYEEYKKNEVVENDKPKSDMPKVESDSDDDDDDQRRRKNDKSKKKSKKKRSHSSDDSSVDRKSRRRRDSSKSSDDDRQKKSKKSKKHKSRDSSSERSSRKNRKKDKEREKTRHKKSDYSDPSERARNKNRRRSRSRSYSPRNRRRARSRSRSPRR